MEPSSRPVSYTHLDVYKRQMQSYWTSVGLDTKLDTTVTVADLRRMNNYDLCVLSTHGAYYTYEYGWLWKRTATAPVLLLTEKSTFWNDLRYGMDLLNHRIIKVNGAYAVTAGFFRAAYRSGALDVYKRQGKVCGSGTQHQDRLAEPLCPHGHQRKPGRRAEVKTPSVKPMRVCQLPRKRSLFRLIATPKPPSEREVASHRR